ncbi:MAG: MBL fold metallo-hydrolase [Chitinophagaceae bacterium]|nr:MAG: MBL fold metallo-hydrolase [Chitinophagaceae bacterium]
MLQIKQFTFNPFQENTYIVYNGHQQAAIVDPGCSTENERKQLTAFIEKNDLKPVLLLNTHCHIDHVLGNAFVSEKWGLALHIHPNEKFVLDHAPMFGEMYGIAMDAYTGPIVYLNEGSTIHIGGDVLDILFTPGHSPGSVSFYSENDGFVLSGDALFSGSIGRTDLPGGNYDTLIEAIKTQLYSLPDATKVYSGHGGGTSIGYEKRNNPFVQGEE